ncbi:hypothetical protein [Winogradskyella haliclonae]|uniref:Uncharacterized protein n=1 Tax=Winogradskyella haliclonae TaxID=2048558 RepID=A0ABQ2BY34_9FLAO|nr:hypothetical protein [Winogradskyella haliclonae]GGI56979.1 hypothetical protein GCM10011444_12880 [Winogradskyella haliclonae]
MNESNDGCFIAMLWVITILISILSGVLAWNWIEPDSFFGAIGFLIIWAILSKIGHFIAVALVAIFGGMK